MWSQFKEEHLSIGDIEGAIQSIKDCFLENVEDNFDILRTMDNMCSEGCSSGDSLLTMMKNSPHLGDVFWRLLFAVIRDRKSNLIDRDKTVPILEGGQTKLMTMKDIEEKFSKENSHILKTCISVPDQMIHEDLIDAHLDVKCLEHSLQKSYELRLSEAKDALAAENPKWKTAQVEQMAAVQAKRETKESKEAEQLKYRVAMKAEEEVQRSIQKALAKFNIPAHVFRGVNTFDDIGQLLESFGIKFSKLKSFKHGESNSSLECEHDINVVALLPSGPLVSFVQVAMQSSPNYFCVPSGENQRGRRSMGPKSRRPKS